MTILSVPPPFGLGSTLAESLHSIVERSAALYGVPTTKMLKLLCDAGSTRASPQDYKRGAEWIGRGELTRTLTRGMELLADRNGFERLCFVGISNAVGQSRELFARSRRVCPRCIAPEAGAGYGMLAHQLIPVLHCPLHGCKLLDRCPRCMAYLSWTHDYFRAPKCASCDSDISQAEAHPLPLDAYSAWRERQLGQLVAFATNEFVEPISSGWIKDFKAAIAALACALEQYSPAERLVIRDIAKRFRVMPESTPSVHTLLRICTMQAVDLCDLLKAPKECCSPRLINLGEVKVPSPSRPTHPLARWKAARGAMLALIEDGPEIYLPPLGNVASQFGVTSPGLWRHYPTETQRYRAERSKRVKMLARRRMRRARNAAHWIALEHHQRGTVIDIRRDGARIMIMAGVAKAQAEIALAAVRDAWRLIGLAEADDVDYWDDTDAEV